MAAKNIIHYFDLTEDMRVTEYVKKLAKHATKAFLTQCGFAPGFISFARH